MNAIPLITVAPIRRPAFDNSCIASQRQWTDSNATLLARYWQDQGNILGVSPTDDTDFDFWLRVQWDIERKSEERRKLPHGSSL